MGADLPALAAGLTAAVGGVCVEVVPGLCRHPARLDALAAAGAPAGTVVAAVCSARPPGWAPAGVRVVSLAMALAVTGGGPAAIRAGVAQLAAAVAAAAARRRALAAGDEPARVALAPARRRDRRWLLSAGLLAGDDPAPRLVEVQAELAQLLTLAPPGGRVVFACAGALDALEEACGTVGVDPGAPWLPLVLPCGTVLTPGWVLQPLAAGVAGVGVARCPDCAGPDDAVRFAQEMLLAYGLDPQHRAVSVLPVDGPELAAVLADAAGGWPPPVPLGGGWTPALPSAGQPAAGEEELVLDEPAATATACLRLTATLAGPPVFVDLACPVGVVRVRESACTLCGACVRSCPTDALSIGPTSVSGQVREPAGALLTLHADRCGACGDCVPACPQQALSVRPAVDVAALRAGRVLLAAAQVGQCRDCGQPLAPDPLLTQVRHRLAGRHAGWADELAALCPACQQARAVSSVGALP